MAIWGLPSSELARLRGTVEAGSDGFAAKVMWIRPARWVVIPGGKGGTYVSKEAVRLLLRALAWSRGAGSERGGGRAGRPARAAGGGRRRPGRGRYRGARTRLRRRAGDGRGRQ